MKNRLTSYTVALAIIASTWAMSADVEALSFECEKNGETILQATPCPGVVYPGNIVSRQQLEPPEETPTAVTGQQTLNDKAWDKAQSPPPSPDLSTRSPYYTPSYAPSTYTVTPIARDKNGHIKRSQSAKNDFKREHPCPANGKRSGSCPGYVIDHITPLACGGADASSNMQWQTTVSAKEKDSWERDGCSATSGYKTKTISYSDGSSFGTKKNYTPRTSSSSSYSGDGELHRGRRGGCYYINGHGNKTYVDRSSCN